MNAKKYCDINVFDASMQRIKTIFDDFESVCVAFSGGKDSTIVLMLCIEYIKRNNLRRKVSVYHLDYEAQYDQTTEFIEGIYKEYADYLEVYHCCIPVKAQCACTMTQGYWVPWEESKKELWVRELPSHAITEQSHTELAKPLVDDYSFNERFAEWLAEQKGKTAVLVGVRADESLHRLAIFTSKDRVNLYDGIKWSKAESKNVVKFYPIYDWTTEDVWVANAKFQWPYNSLYDLFYQSGLSIDKMRVASPFNDAAIHSVKLYKAINPNMWAKMIGRVNGVNFAGIYGGTTAMGWKNITLPKGHTWKSYMNFLLNTLPDDVRENYVRKLEASKKSWLVGGAMDEQTIKELENEGAPIRKTGKSNNRSKHKKEVVQFDDYLDDTSVTDFKRIPTYKRMCICIMKNDYYCKYMGFAQTKNEAEKRKRAVENYEDIF